MVNVAQDRHTEEQPAQSTSSATVQAVNTILPCCSTFLFLFPGAYFYPADSKQSSQPAQIYLHITTSERNSFVPLLKSIRYKFYIRNIQFSFQQTCKEHYLLATAASIAFVVSRKVLESMNSSIFLIFRLPSSVTISAMVIAS